MKKEKTESAFLERGTIRFMQRWSAAGGFYNIVWGDVKGTRLIGRYRNVTFYIRITMYA
jgi:hypothetical protein